MITRLSGNILNLHARRIFSSVLISPKSWFHQVRRWCDLYSLPHPLDLLEYPRSKEEFKKLVKKRAVDYWEKLLRAVITVLLQAVLHVTYFLPSNLHYCRVFTIKSSNGYYSGIHAFRSVQNGSLMQTLDKQKWKLSPIGGLF